MNEADIPALAEELNVGKRLPGAVYLHRSLLKDVPPSLCSLIERISSALKLTPDDWNVIKVHRDWPRLSFLYYSDFDEDSYPSLIRSKIVDLSRKTVRDMSFEDDFESPILHRKELMVSTDYPGREDFISITAEGEAAGLYADTRRIGFRRNWHALITSKGYELVDGRLFRSSALSTTADTEIRRDRTAISRTQLSAPMQLLSRLGYLEGQFSVCDYGCGRGDDLTILENLGVDGVGWDPNHRPEGERIPSDIVNLGFVINVIEDRKERDHALTTAYQLAEKALIVSAMIASDAHIAKFKPFNDGVITSRNTFQKYYDQAELKEYIEQTLGTPAVPAASGVFLVFRDEDFEANYRFARYGPRKRERQRVHKPTRAEKLRQLIDQNSELCDEYWFQSLERGRWLGANECESSTQLVALFGSLRKAQRAFLEAYDATDFSEAETRRAEELVFRSQAMAMFQRRSPFSHLPDDLKADIRYFYSSYRELQNRSELLLSSLVETEQISAACIALVEANAAVFHEAAKALTLPVTLLNELPLLLRAYIGCAEQLVGDAQTFHLLKIHIHTGKVSFMRYEGFEDGPIPMLVERIKVDLWNQRVRYYDYVDEFTPRPLYWRSKFLSPNDETKRKQAGFDRRLDELGLAPDNPHFGFALSELHEILRHKRIEIRGHRFYKMTAS